jgi:hypothetical protein
MLPQLLCDFLSVTEPALSEVEGCPSWLMFLL